MKHRTFPILFATLVALAALACGDSVTPVKITTTPPPSAFSVTFAGGQITAEIAATVAARETGLMNRSSMGQDAGMLFVFPIDENPLLAGFWMKNTSIALSIAFMDSTKRVLSVQDMVPFDTVNIHQSPSFYRYALEVNKGWFATHGVLAGAQAAFTLPAGTIPSR